jgi:hypothetical protein
MGRGAQMRRFRFDPARSNGEDAEFLIKILRAGATLYPLPEVALHYRWRPNSAVHGDLCRHAYSLVDMLEHFTSPHGDANTWAESDVRPQQAALLRNLSLQLALMAAEPDTRKDATARALALQAQSSAAAAPVGTFGLWIAAVRVFHLPLTSRALAERVCARASYLLDLAEAWAAHETFANAIRTFVDEALQRADPVSAVDS